MKKILLIIFVSLFIVCGCESTNGSTNNGVGNGSSNQKALDHKVYKYVKASSPSGSNLLYSAGIFGDTFEVGYADEKYKPTVLLSFDTTTGNATKAKFYTFFLDYEDNEWVNKAIEKYNNSSSESKKYYQNVKKGRVNDEVSYLECDLDLSGYIFTQFLDSYIVKGQDIERYKDRIYYSRLYNYSSEPPHEEGENFFEETLEGIRLEWSDSEIAAF